MHTYIGIDPSINSTGLTIIDNDKEYFYLIKPLLSKAEKSCQNAFANFKYVLYDKQNIDKSDPYWKRERSKLYNFLNIVKKIKQTVDSFNGLKTIVMEGMSYGSRTSSLCDLSGLNYLLREAFKDDNLYVYSPSEIKKFASGNGNCNKQTMIDLFLGIHPEFALIPKIDDVSDSYFMSQLKKTKISPLI